MLRIFLRGGGGVNGAFSPLNHFTPFELGLNDELVSSCTQQSVEVLPLCSFKNLNLHLLNLFSIKPLMCVFIHAIGMHKMIILLLSLLSLATQNLFILQT